MSSASSHRPVLLLHPDHAEADYLRDRLAREGILHPILISPSVEDAQDYLLAAALAHPVDSRYTPCLAFVDEKLGETDVRGFADWVHAQPALSSLQVVRLTSADAPAPAAADSWGTDTVIGPKDRVRLLRTMIARECRDT